MNQRRALAIRRIAAFVLDWFVVVLWGGVLLGAVMWATDGSPSAPESPWKGQLIGFVAMTLPVTLYFTCMEASSRQASLGKRVVGLTVRGESGGRLSFGSALLRNAVKFLPWELGHTVANQAAFSGESGVPGWVWGPMAISMFVPLWWGIALIMTGRTPYDRWASARVARATGVATEGEG